MKKSILCNFSVLICILFLSNPDANAQTAAEIDSLNAIIEHGNDSLKIDALNELSILFCESDLLRAEMNARNAIALSKKTGSKSLLARSMLRLGSVYDYKEKFDSASMVYYQALRIAESINDSLTMGKIYMNIGVMHYFQGNINEADKFYLLSTGLFSRLGNDENLSKAYNNLGTVRRKQDKYDEAISYYNKSLQLKKKLNDIRGANKTYFNIAIVYEYKGLLDSSIAIIKQSILFDQSKKDFFSLTHDYITLGEIYTKKNDLVNALANYDTAIFLLKSYPNNYLYLKVYQGKLSVDTLLNNYKDALYHSQKITEYKDLLYNEEINSKTATIAAIYENEKKEEKIKLQTKQLKQKNVILILGLILLGLISVLAGVIYYSLQRKKKDNLLLSKQKREIEAKTEQVKNQAEEIARHQSQMNPHFVYNALSSIQHIISEQKVDLANQQIGEFAKLMRATLNNADKRAVTLEEEIDFLKRYIAFEQKNSATPFSFEIHTDTGLDIENTAIPAMLIQPLLENSIKHGIADKTDGRLKLLFTRKENALHILIDDNGNGRKQKTYMSHASKAVSIIEKRINAFNEEHSFVQTKPITYIDKKDSNGQAIGTVAEIVLFYQELY